MANTQYVPNIRRRYLEKAVPEMMKKFGYKNINQVPRLRTDRTKVTSIPYTLPRCDWFGW